MRAILFDGRTPKPAFSRVVLHKSGRPRRAFSRWLSAEPGNHDSANDAGGNCYRVTKTGDLGGDVVVLALYSADGFLSDLHRSQVRAYADAGYEVVVVVNSAAFARGSEILEDAATTIIIRENSGFDFGAWRHAISIVGGLDRVNTLAFTNDSVLPLSADALRRARVAALAAPEDVVFLTANKEVRPHAQSYFFLLKRSALKAGALSVMENIPVFECKDELIHKVEMRLSNRFTDQGHSVGVLYSSAAADEAGVNPTIHHWEDLIANGFPYLKIQLFSAGFLTTDDPKVLRYLPKETQRALVAHLDRRATDDFVRTSDENLPARRVCATDGRFNEHGVLQSWNLPAPACRTLLLPFQGIKDAVVAPRRTLAVLHCYYTDVAETILTHMTGLDADFVYALTTDTEVKADILRKVVKKLGLRADVMVCENRGRDVAPFLSACARHLQNVDLILHLHTKKSPHDDVLGGWAPYLYENLVGSTEIVRSIQKIMETDDVGIVYSGHFKPVAERRNWGYDFALARKLLSRMGVALSADQILEFPTGTMFWAKPESLAPLLDLHLQAGEFEPEDGQEDGTLAHAIERIILYVAESRGYRALRVASSTSIPNLAGENLMLGLADVGGFLKRLPMRLLSSNGPRSRFQKEVSEVYPVSVAGSRCSKRRFNILIPTVQPEKIYGGIATALKLAFSTYRQLGDCDLRIIITSDIVDRHGLSQLSAALGHSVVLADPDADVAGITAVALLRRRYIPLSVRPRDLFFATAWWTADLGFRLRDQQERIFAAAAPMVYLIQDYEPGFYNWSSKFGMAEATYHRPDHTIAVINSEELAAFMARRAAFTSAFCLPFAVNPHILAKLKPTVKEKIILAYGRPSVERNAFGAIVEGLRLWQGRNPDENCGYSIVFAGENFDTSLLAELENATCKDKLNLEDYADILNRAAIGVSLMLSPHPSYPPLEMASAGMVTITNDYESKTMGGRHDAIISISYISPVALADALDLAKTQIELGRLISPVPVKPLPTTYPIFDAAELASRLGQA